MMQSLRSRLTVLIVVLSIAAVAIGGLMVGLFYQSASAQAAQSEAEIARACDSVAATYRFYGAGWHGPDSLHDPALLVDLTTLVQTALHDRTAIEGGIWQEEAGSLAYAYPTYQGAAPKNDVPAAELPRIGSINRAARAGDHVIVRRFAAGSSVLLLAACPLPGPIPRLTAWTMTRVVTFAGRAYRQLMTGLGVLLTAVVVATTLLARLTLAWSRHVVGIERALQARDVLHLPLIGMTGEKELDQIVDALNMAGRRLAEAGARSEELAQRVARGERLAAIGRVAAGVAHEIRNPIAAMRLKAENALAGDAARKDEALAMIVGQIGRLDRLLTRLLSLTEPDPPRRQSIRLRDLLEGCVAEHADLARARNVALQSEVHAPADTADIDPDQMRRALGNLLLNAIEAAPAHSRVVLSARRDDEWVVLAVHDAGSGPPAAVRAHLFEPFVTGRADGTGLGLSLVRETAGAHGGTARLADESGGTTFEIRIPWR